MLKLMRELHQDEGGLQVAEMVLLFAAVLVPVIIAVGFFSEDIMGFLSSETKEGGEAGKNVKYEKVLK